MCGGAIEEVEEVWRRCSRGVGAVMEEVEAEESTVWRVVLEGVNMCWVSGDPVWRSLTVCGGELWVIYRRPRVVSPRYRPGPYPIITYCTIPYHTIPYKDPYVNPTMFPAS